MAAPAPEPPTEDTLRIEELARATGLSVRNVRAHQERGLLPPPTVRGRVGFYGEAHIERIQLIQSLQAEGLKLDGIKRLLEESHSDGSGLLRVKHATDAFAEEEAPEIVDAAEVLERLAVPPERADEVLTRAHKLGLALPIGGGRYQLLSPSLLEAAEQVVLAGLPFESALKLVEEVGRHSETIAKRFVKAFLADVWEPFVEAGMPEEEWTRISEAIEQMRPAAAQALLAVFRQKLAHEAEDAFAQIARRLSKGAR